MAQRNPFTRPTIDLHAPGGLEALFARNKALYGGWRMGPPDPLTGGDDAAAATAAAAAATAAAAAASAAQQQTDQGFPSGTSLELMTAAQQAAYWKHNSRKHEDRVKGLDNLTPEQLKELREKAQKHDALEHELKSDKDKAVDDAKTSTRAEADAEYQPKLVRAEFKAAAAGRLTVERLTTILEPLDLSKFLTSGGDVDTDKVKTYVDGIAPARGSTSSGPVLTRHGGTGSGNGSGDGNRPGSVAQVMEERRAAREAKKQSA